MGVSQWREHGKQYGYWKYFEKQILEILNEAEKLIDILDPDEKNKDLMTLYRFIHSYNPNHSCTHPDWVEEFKDLIK